MFSYLPSTTTVNSTRACTNVHETINPLVLVLVKIPVPVLVQTISKVQSEEVHQYKNPATEDKIPTLRPAVKEHNSYPFHISLQPNHWLGCRNIKKFLKAFYPFNGVSCDSNAINEGKHFMSLLSSHLENKWGLHVNLLLALFEAVEICMIC